MSWKRRTALSIAPLFLALSVGVVGCASSGGDDVESEEQSTGGQSVADQNLDPSGGAGGTQLEGPIEFKDPVFEELVKTELGKNEILPSDLAEFTSVMIVADEFVFLTAPGEEEETIVHFYDDQFEFEDVRYQGYGTMKSLEDLLYFGALDKLYVTLQPDIDYSTIPENIADQVRIVHIYQSKLKDIGFLESFDNLVALTVNTNEVQSIDVLEGKDTIWYLTVSGNQIESIEPVASLIELRRLTAQRNNISDISPLANLAHLESIELYDNKIKDISPLKEVKTLTSVELINNQIEDVSPLQDFESFEELRLSGNPIKNIEALSHIPTVEFDQD